MNVTASFRRPFAIHYFSPGDRNRIIFFCNEIFLLVSNVPELPPSIGKLKNLKEIVDLSCIRRLSTLPEEIGNLSGLIKLDLRSTNIRSLRPFIGTLEHDLKEIDLSDTERLPEEIGNLSSLIKLDLHSSGISSIFPVIAPTSCQSERESDGKEAASSIGSDALQLKTAVEDSTNAKASEPSREQLEEDIASPPDADAAAAATRKGGDDEKAAVESEQKKLTSMLANEGSIPISAMTATTTYSSSTPSSGRQHSSSTPGAFRVEGFASRERRLANGGDEETGDANSTLVASNENESDNDVDVESSVVPQAKVSTRHLSTTTMVVDISTTAYVVEEETEVRGVATVVETRCGIEKKKFTNLVGLALVVVAIVLGVVIDAALKSKNYNNEVAPEERQKSCWPLCGEGYDVPDPELIILGNSCKNWNLESIVTNPETLQVTCEQRYSAAAYSCGCTEFKIPSDGCGRLCKDSSGEDGIELPDPNKVVMDIHGVEWTCGEWELLAKFDTTGGQSCTDYHSVGILCGCPANLPTPKHACGPLCENNLLPNPGKSVWGQTCEEWNILTSYLPPWSVSMDTKGEITCSALFQDVAYDCGCPEITEPPPQRVQRSVPGTNTLLGFAVLRWVGDSGSFHGRPGSDLPRVGLFCPPSEPRRNVLLFRYGGGRMRLHQQSPSTRRLWATLRRQRGNDSSASRQDCPGPDLLPVELHGDLPLRGLRVGHAQHRQHDSLVRFLLWAPGIRMWMCRQATTGQRMWEAVRRRRVGSRPEENHRGPDVR
jgi:hypothetical protein